MLKCEVRDSDENDVKTDNHQGADGNVDNNVWFVFVKDFATIEHTKEETNICRIEEDDVQHVLIWEKGFQVPGEKKDACKEAEDTTDSIAFQATVSKQMILPPKITYIIIW